jgi:phosphatidylglycerol:prolipoprotein diacylglycerol transferase
MFFFQSPGSVLFKIGPLTIRWYGIMIALGFLAATSAATRLAKRWEIDADKILNLALFCFIGGIVGARLYYVALMWTEFSQHPLEIFFSSTEGFSIRGLSIHGGILGALVVGLIYCRRVKIPFWSSCDVIATALPLGQGIGRWGNFFNSEAFGKPVSEHFPLQLFIPQDQRPMLFRNFEYFHPTFLYECAWDLMLFAVLYFYAADKLKRFPGLTFFVYVAGYSIGRLMIEPLRTDSIMVASTTLPWPILVSALMLAVALVGIAFILFKHRKQQAPQA